jgi:hypothetical protein
MALIWKQQPKDFTLLNASSASTSTDALLNGEYASMHVQVEPAAAYPSTGTFSFYGSLEDDASPTYVLLPNRNAHGPMLSYMGSTVSVILDFDVTGLKRFYAAVGSTSTKAVTIKAVANALPPGAAPMSPTDGLLLASTSRQSTAVVSSADQINHGARGVIVTVNFSAGTTSTAATMNGTVQYKDVAGNYIDLTQSTGSTSTGIYMLIVYPGASTLSLSTASVVSSRAISMPLPRVWRFSQAASASTKTTQITYSAAYSLVP